MRACREGYDDDSQSRFIQTFIFTGRRPKACRSTGHFLGEEEEQDAEFFQELEPLAGNSNDWLSLGDQA